MTDAERLDLLALLLARKRAEKMGRLPETPINFETLLAIAAAPAAILEQIVTDRDALVTFLVSGGEILLIDVETKRRKTRPELWADFERDIRTFFPPTSWPRWLNHANE